SRLEVVELGGGAAELELDDHWRGLAWRSLPQASPRLGTNEAGTTLVSSCRGPAMPPVRSVLTCALVSLAAVACAARPSEPVEPQATAKPEVVEPDVVADACAERSLAAAIDEGRAALEAGV